jgi:hypothetical protein
MKGQNVPPKLWQTSIKLHGIITYRIHWLLLLLLVVVVVVVRISVAYILWFLSLCMMSHKCRDIFEAAL